MYNQFRIQSAQYRTQFRPFVLLTEISSLKSEFLGRERCFKSDFGDRCRLTHDLIVKNTGLTAAEQPRIDVITYTKDVAHPNPPDRIRGRTEIVHQDRDKKDDALLPTEQRNCSVIYIRDLRNLIQTLGVPERGERVILFEEIRIRYSGFNGNESYIYHKKIRYLLDEDAWRPAPEILECFEYLKVEGKNCDWVPPTQLSELQRHREICPPWLCIQLARHGSRTTVEDDVFKQGESLLKFGIQPTAFGRG
jgi:hypothetical protein